MAAGTGIEWTEATWNPTTGCDRISPGCDHCYALALARRLKAMGQPKYQNDGDPRTSGPGFAVTMHPGVLAEPLRWRTPRTVFVNSMGDVGHARVSRSFAARMWAVMALAERHTFQVLTKRPNRLAAMLADPGFAGEVAHRDLPGLRSVRTRSGSTPSASVRRRDMHPGCGVTGRPHRLYFGLVRSLVLTDLSQEHRSLVSVPSAARTRQLPR